MSIITAAHRLNENVWFELFQPLLLKIINTDYGRDLLDIPKDIGTIDKFAKNLVRTTDEKGMHESRFHVGDKWGKTIRNRWKEFSEYAKHFYEKEVYGQKILMPLLNYNGQLIAAHASDTFYPDAHPESNSVDGYITRDNGSEESWDAAHDAAGGTAADDSAATFTVQSKFWTASNLYIFRRAIVGFDTSSIGSDTVAGATLILTVSGNQNVDNDGDDWITVVEASPASDTALATGDYDAVGDAIDDPTEGIDSGDRKDISSYSGGQMVLNLNDTGVGWIDTAGATNFGLREGHDVIDSPIVVTGEGNAAAFHSADSASDDPFLLVSHSAAAAAGGGIVAGIF